MKYILLYWHKGKTKYVNLSADNDKKAFEDAIDIVSLETDNPDTPFEVLECRIIATEETENI